MNSSASCISAAKRYTSRLAGKENPRPVPCQTLYVVGSRTTARKSRSRRHLYVHRILLTIGLLIYQWLYQYVC